MTVEFLTNALVTLLVIVEPLALVPIFLGAVSYTHLDVYKRQPV